MENNHIDIPHVYPNEKSSTNNNQLNFYGVNGR